MFAAYGVIEESKFFRQKDAGFVRFEKPEAVDKVCTLYDELSVLNNV